MAFIFAVISFSLMSACLMGALSPRNLNAFLPAPFFIFSRASFFSWAFAESASLRACFCFFFSPWPRTLRRTFLRLSYLFLSTLAWIHSQSQDSHGAHLLVGR